MSKVFVLFIMIIVSFNVFSDVTGVNASGEINLFNEIQGNHYMQLYNRNTGNLEWQELVNISLIGEGIYLVYSLVSKKTAQITIVRKRGGYVLTYLLFGMPSYKSQRFLPKIIRRNTFISGNKLIFEAISIDSSSIMSLSASIE